MYSTETCSQMSRYRIGRIEGRWTNFVPPIRGGIYRAYDKDESDVELLKS